MVRPPAESKTDAGRAAGLASERIGGVGKVVAASAVEGGSAQPGGDGLFGGLAALGVEEIAAGAGEDGDGLAIGWERVTTAGELLGDEVFDGICEDRGGAFEVGQAVAVIVQAKERGGERDGSGSEGESRHVHGREIGRGKEKFRAGREGRKKAGEFPLSQPWRLAAMGVRPRSRVTISGLADGGNGMSSAQEPGYGVRHTADGAAGHGSIHETEHGMGHGSGHETGTFLDTWWPVLVIGFGVTFFTVVALWHPSY